MPVFVSGNFHQCACVETASMQFGKGAWYHVEKRRFAGQQQQRFKVFSVVAAVPHLVPRFYVSFYWYLRAC